MIHQEKWNALEDRLHRLGIVKEDLVIKSILGQGPGGQHAQKTSSTVYIHHLPSGIAVKYGKERSRLLNEYRAFQLLCDQLEAHRTGRPVHHDAHEKIRKQKARRNKRHQTKKLKMN